MHNTQMVANLLKYICAKIYQTRVSFNKVIATINWCIFLPYSRPIFNSVTAWLYECRGD